MLVDNNPLCFPPNIGLIKNVRGPTILHYQFEKFTYNINLSKLTLNRAVIHRGQNVLLLDEKWS